MSDPVYLYGYGKTKHIAALPVRECGQAVSCCQLWQETEERTLARLTRWSGTKGAELAMASKRRLPVCKHCAKAHAKAVPP